MISYTIDGELTDQNTYFSAERTNRFNGAKVKKNNTWICTLAAQHLEPIGKTPFRLSIDWYVKNRRKDPDNIAFAVKFILDGLQQAGIIDNDGFKQVLSINHRAFYVDKTNPRAVIHLELVE